MFNQGFPQKFDEGLNNSWWDTNTDNQAWYQRSILPDSWGLNDVAFTPAQTGSDVAEQYKGSDIQQQGLVPYAASGLSSFVFGQPINVLGFDIPSYVLYGGIGLILYTTLAASTVPKVSFGGGRSYGRY